MNSTQIHITYKTALNFLAEGKLKTTFEKTSLLINELQWGEYTDRHDELFQNYQLILKYYEIGTEDSQRKSIYNKLIAKIFVLLSELREELLFRNSSNFEYTQKRYFPYRLHFKGSDELFTSLSYYHNQKELIYNSPEPDVNQLKKIRHNFESVLPDLFCIFWLSTHIVNSEKKLFTQLMHDDYQGNTEKALVVSALTMNLWRMFDEQKLMLLFDCIDNSDVSVRQRAMAGLCFVLAKYNRFLVYFPTVRNRLVILADNNHYQENFRNIIIQIIATLETDKISKKLKEEILPEIMKISPALKDKMDAEKLLKSDEWDEGNPEWQELLEKSGVYDKIKELTELQMEGADVYMSTFSMLKSFSFFNEISNWFLPFDSEFLAVEELFTDNENSVMSAFTGNNMMCNSDKYSFCLSILQMPEAQRNMIKNSFKAESEQLQEINSEEAILKPDNVAKNISKQYIQDLFRFFRLYPQKGEFSDMFESSLFMHKTYLFDVLAASSDLKSNIAEYYFIKEHYREAIELFNELIEESEQPSALIYQKLGFSYQKISKLQKALDAYLKADMFQPDDLWTIRKIALCYRLSGEYDKAISFYQHYNFLSPDELNTDLNISKCLIQLNRHAEALKILYKLDAENEGNVKIMRSLFWCNFVTGNVDKALYYSNALLLIMPDYQDYMNAGHIEFCKKNLSVAFNNYSKVIELMDYNWDKFFNLFSEDKKYLLSNGLEPFELNLLLDTLLYNFNGILKEDSEI